MRTKSLSRLEDPTESVKRASGTEQDAVLKLEKERAEIVSKYDKGKEGATVEPWEDASFHLYKVIDRFGFVHENDLPSYDSVEEKQKHIEVERTSKWLKMMKSWDKYKNSEKVRSLFLPHHLSPFLHSSLKIFNSHIPVVKYYIPHSSPCASHLFFSLVNKY
nr:USP6 N-terminal-like protein [Oncorhynchus nerka]